MLWMLSALAVCGVAVYSFVTIAALRRSRHTTPAGKWILGGIFLVFGGLSFLLGGRVLSILGGSHPARVGRWLAAIGGELAAVLLLVLLSALVALVVHYVARMEERHGGARA